MQCNATESKQAGAGSAGKTDKRPSHAPQFTKVLDGRKHPIRGLWRTKTGRYYAQLQFENETTGEKTVHRVPLVDKDKRPVETVPEAVKALARLRTKREDGDVPLLGRSPRFKDYAKHYLEFIKAGEGMKKPGTINKEEGELREWEKDIGEVPLNKIQPYHVNQFRKRRLEAGAGHLTVNGNVVTLRNVLRLAKTEGLLKLLPTMDIKPLKGKSPRRPLFTAADIDRLCAAAFETKTNEAGEKVPVTKNAQEFADYVRLLAYSGAREEEALALRWADVDFERGQLTIGATGDTKNRTGRTVDFNPKLRAHLEDMATRLAPDSQWLFPSPQRGDKDKHVETFRASLVLARRQAGMEHKPEPADGARKTIKRERHGMAFHDLRHHFISYCVMSGIDYMTIASWVGHRDGGVLIGKVYGHLADAHKKAQADKLNFGPAVVEAKEAI
jgi:integrase